MSPHRDSNGSIQGRGGWYRRWFAWMMAHGASGVEVAIGERKHHLLSSLRGTVLEIGPGTGANLRHYHPDVYLVGIEPNIHMHPYFQTEANRIGRAVDLRIGFGEGLELEDGSVDAVVATHVLCSVDDVDRVIAEAYRVLKPGGRFCFLEHVAAPEGSFQLRLQKLIRPLWGVLGDGCRPDRDPLPAVTLAGFREWHAEPFYLPLPVIGPHLSGYAVK